VAARSGPGPATCADLILYKSIIIRYPNYVSIEPSSQTVPAELRVGVGRTVARLGRQVELALAVIDLTTAQYRTLTQLGDGAEASSSLAAKLAVSRPTVTAVVEGLAERGLVDRRHSQADRRRVSVNLTDSGRAMLARADEVVSTKLAEVLAAVNPGQAAAAVNGILQWESALDANKIRKHSASGEPMPVAAV
jgi:DNA-binding MarR family transcriptional regulator